MILINRLAGLIVGAIIAAVGVVMVVEGIRTGIDGSFEWIPGNDWLTTLQTTAWSATTVIVVAAIAAAAGVIVLAAEVRPRRKRLVTVAGPGPGTWKLVRRSAEGHIQRRLAAQVPTKPIKVRLRPGRRRWRLKVKARSASASRSLLEATGRSELAALGAPERSKVTVKTRRKAPPPHPPSNSGVYKPDASSTGPSPAGGPDSLPVGAEA
ncbi:MAG: hypothetical protein M3137_05350 [Actinomycetota bacterium]|nr:hypothetical protein [Actinomycetota bacterium]